MNIHSVFPLDELDEYRTQLLNLPNYPSLVSSPAIFNEEYL